MRSVCCPSCQAVLRTPEQPAGRRQVKCSKCGHLFYLSARDGPDFQNLSAFWENVQIPDLDPDAEQIAAGPTELPRVDSPHAETPRAPPSQTNPHQPNRSRSNQTQPSQPQPSQPQPSRPQPSRPQPSRPRANSRSRPNQPRRAETPPVTVEATSRGWIIAAAAGGAGLGLIIALWIALFLSGRGRELTAGGLQVKATATEPISVEPSSSIPPAANPSATITQASVPLPSVPTPSVPQTTPPEPVGETPVPTPSRSIPVEPLKTIGSEFDDWPQDLTTAGRLAKAQGKDLFILFDSSDYASPSMSLAAEVFSRPDLWKRLSARFVPVHIDFPEHPTALRRVRDPAANKALRDRYQKRPAYPRVVLTDTDGRPFHYEEGYRDTPEVFVAKLERATRVRVDRDILLDAIGRATGPDKLPAARKALDFLNKEVEGPSWRTDGTYVLGLREFYGPELIEFRRLADEFDPDNRGGHRECFFWHDWIRRTKWALADPATTPAAHRALTTEFAGWVAGCRLQPGSDFAISLWVYQANLLGQLNDPSGREKAVRAALALEPSADWRKSLNKMLRTGSGLAVGASAPEIDGKDLAGKPMKLSALRGKVTLVIFWASWCGACRRTLPLTQTLAQKYKGKPFAIVGVNCDDNKEAGRAAVEEEKLTWRSWWDGDREFAVQWHLESFPTVYLLDADGVIQKKCGSREAEDLPKAIDALLAKMSNKK